MLRQLTRAQRRVVQLLRAGRRCVVEQDPENGVMRAVLYTLDGQVKRVHARTIYAVRDAGLIEKSCGFAGTMTMYRLKEGAGDES